MSLVNRYLQKEFQYKTYNCFSFARDVWKELTGTDLGDQSSDISGSQQYTDRALKVANTLKSLEKPEDPCIVLFMRSRLEPHIGIYYRGKVLHLSRSGAFHMPLEHVAIGYTQVTFYK